MWYMYTEQEENYKVKAMFIRCKRVTIKFAVDTLHESNCVNSSVYNHQTTKLTTRQSKLVCMTRTCDTLHSSSCILIIILVVF